MLTQGEAIFPTRIIIIIEIIMNIKAIKVAYYYYVACLRG